MRFAWSAALWLLPLALLPWLARRTRPMRRVPVGAIQFWASAAAREAAPLPRRLRRHWLALVQAAIVAAIVLALAGPWRTPGGGVVAVVVDTSLSMSAVAARQTRLALAAQRAAEWAARLPPGTRVRLLTSAPAPSLIGEYPARDEAFTRALNALRPSDAGGRLEDAVAAVRAGDPTPGRVLVVTDASAPLELAGTEWATVGGPTSNAAIVTLEARRAQATSPQADVIAHVRNYGASALSTTLTFTADGRTLRRQPFTVPPQSGASAAIVIRESTRVVTATIDTNDAIAADNTRSTIVPPPLAVRVAVTGASGADSFLAQALRSRQGVEIVADVERADVLVCAGCAPEAAVAAARPGIGMLIVPPAPTAPLAPAPLASVGGRGGLRTPAGLDGIEAVAMAGPETSADAVIATAGQRPAIVAFDAGDRRVIELRLDLERSPLSLTPAFPILMADLIDWLALRDLQDAVFEAGRTAVWRAPRGAGPATVVGPRGTPIAAVSEGERLVVGDTSTAGVYRVRRGAAAVSFVVNPATGGESDLGATAAGPVLAPHLPLETATRADLTALVLAGALLLLVVEWRLRPGPWRSRRAVVAALLLSAFAAPRIPWGEAPRVIVFALDVSDSMDARRAEALAFVRSTTARMRGSDRSGLVVFGGGAAVERPLDAAPMAGTAPTARIAGSATNLEQGLRTARAALPGGAAGRVVLVSDGRETAGDVRAEALAARAAGVAIDVFAPRPGRAAARPTVTRVTAPPTVHGGERFDVQATVEGTPGTTGVVVFDGGAEPLRRPVTLPASGATTVTAGMRADQPGFSVYRASIEAGSELADFSDDPAGAVVASAGDAQLLYVSTAAPIGLPNGYRVARAAPGTVPRTATALAGYDVVVLDDVEPEQLDEAQRRAIAQHVEQGGGLFVLGGPRSLTPGRDALDDALPLDLRPRRGQRAPGLALVVVFDKSGSMDDRIDGAPKIEFARQAVERVLAALPPTDAVGVIAFDSGAVDVAPLRPGHEAASLAERLGGVRPSGATAIAPAVERAVGWLRGPAAAAYARRLVLLVSDGRTSPADQARARVALRVPGIEVSTVALGDEADRRFLSELASAGNGRAFSPRRLSELPALAAREAVRVSGGHVMNERFTVQPSRHPVLAGLDTSAMPTLGGYVVGSPKAGTEVALRSPLGDPVLALWRHGLGKVAVYTADLRSPWSAGFREWRDGPVVLAQTTRWVSRRVDHPFLYTAITERNGRLALVVDARGGDGAFLNQLDVRVQARTPAGVADDLVLAPAGPGVYEASLPLADPGPYLFSIAATAPDGALDARVQRGFFWTAAQERAGETNAAALAEIARITGGRVLSAADDPFSGPRPRDRYDIGPWLAGLALLLFLSDVLRLFAARPRPGRRTTVDTPRREAA